MKKRELPLELPHPGSYGRGGPGTGFAFVEPRGGLATDDERPPKKIKYEKPMVVDLTGHYPIAEGLCNYGSRPGVGQQCASGGFADSPCNTGGTLQGCKAGSAAVGSCSSGTGRI